MTRIGVAAAATAALLTFEPQPSLAQGYMNDAIANAVQNPIHCLPLPTVPSVVKRKTKASDDLFQQYLGAVIGRDQAALGKMFHRKGGGWRGLDGVVRQGGPDDPIPMLDETAGAPAASQFSRQSIVVALAWTGSRMIWRGPGPAVAGSPPALVDYVVDIDADKWAGRFRIWRVTVLEAGTAAVLPKEVCQLTELPSMWPPASS